MNSELEKFEYLMNCKRQVEEKENQIGTQPVKSTGKKKIIAISFGKKNGNCEKYIKAAAMGAEELGVETNIIRTCDLTVKPCRSCGGCIVALSKGEIAKCQIQDDDAQWLLDQACLGENALIVAAPIFHLMSNASLLALCQRMHPTMCNNLDMLVKRKVSGIISCGGGMDGWTSLGLAIPHIWVDHFSKVVDQVQVEDRMKDIDWFERCRELGRNIASAMLKPIEEAKFVGNASSLACPVCHCDVLRMPDYEDREPKKGEFRHKRSDVICPICQVHGDFYHDESGKLKIKWDEWDAEHSRFSQYGTYEHLNLITSTAHLWPARNKSPEMVEFKKRINAYGTYLTRDQDEAE